MKPSDYRALRDKLKLTQQALADLLGVHKITVAKREAGTLKVNREAELAIRALKPQKGFAEVEKQWRK